MIKQIKQFFCRHKYEIVVTSGIGRFRILSVIQKDTTDICCYCSKCKKIFKIYTL